LYYDDDVNLNKMNAENEDRFLHCLATTVKTNLTKRHAAVILWRASMLEACGFMHTLWWVKYYIHNDTPCSVSQNDFCCSFRRV